MKQIFKRSVCLLLCTVMIACAFPMIAKAYGPPLRLPKFGPDDTFAEKVYAVACSQEGYSEDRLGGTVFGEWWTEVTDIGYDCRRSDWCAFFICWCMDQAGLPYGFCYNKLSGMVDYMYDLLSVNGSALYTPDQGYTPQLGDLVFYSYDGGETLGHVAIAGGDGTYVHANYADRVAIRKGWTVFRMADGEYYEPIYIVSPNYNLNAGSATKDLVRAALGFGAGILYVPGALKKELEKLAEDEEYADVQPPVIVDEVIPGDADRDGKVSASDARLVLRASVALEKLDEEQLKRADLNRDTVCTAEEARLILRAAVGLEELSFAE